MKLGSLLSILILGTAIIYGEWRGSQEKKVRVLTTGVTVVATVIGIILLYNPHFPGPTHVVKLLFGSLDKRMK